MQEIGTGTSFIKDEIGVPTNLFVVQSATDGTTITVSGINDGVYLFELAQATAAGEMITVRDKCKCTNLLVGREIGAAFGTWNTGANTSGNIYDNTQGVYVTPEGAWATTYAMSDDGLGSRYVHILIYINASSRIK